MAKYIGNVISDTNLRLEKGLKRYPSLDMVDRSLPTLIVGIDKARNAINNFSILKKRYEKDTLWWTFARTERLYDYKTDIQLFYKHCVSNVDRNIEYEFVDILKMSRQRAKKMLSYVYSDDKKYIYNDENKFVFIYSPKYCRIWGFSLTTAAYCGISPSRLLKRLTDNASNEFITDFSEVPYGLRMAVGDKTHKLMILFDYFVK